MTVRTLTKFRNPDRTSDLNERLSTLINKGVFVGGQVTPVAGNLEVDIQPLGAMGADGMVTLLEATPERVSVTAGITQYVIMHAEYVANDVPIVTFEVLTQSAFSALNDAERAARFVLAVIDLPTGTTEVDPDLIDTTTADHIDQQGRSFLRGSAATVTALPDYSFPPTGDTTQNRIGDVYYVEDDRLFYAWQVNPSTSVAGWLQIISTAAEARLDDHKNNLDDGTLPPDFFEAQHVKVPFRESHDEGSASTKAMAAAGTAFGAGNALVDEKYPIGIRQRIEFTGLAAVTQVLLVGFYYIGKGAIGTARNFFRLAAPGTDYPLVGTDNGKITISEIRDNSDTFQLTPSGDADSLGFYENPIVVFDFAATGDSDVTGDVSVLCGARNFSGQVTPFDTLDRASFILHEASGVYYPGKTGAASFADPDFDITPSDVKTAIDRLLDEVNKRVSKGGDIITVQSAVSTTALIVSASSPAAGVGGAAVSGAGGDGGTGGSGEGGRGLIGVGGYAGGSNGGDGVFGEGGGSDSASPAGIGVHGVGGLVDDPSVFPGSGVKGEGSEAEDENGGIGVEGIGGGTTGATGGAGVTGAGGAGVDQTEGGSGVEGAGTHAGSGVKGTGGNTTTASLDGGSGVTGVGGTSGGASADGGIGVEGTGAAGTVNGGVGGSFIGGAGGTGIDGAGVYGQSGDGRGVDGFSTSGPGVRGSGGPIGVDGNASSSTGVGVRGVAEGGTGAISVLGDSSGDEGTGVKGIGGTAGTGVHGDSETGYGVVAETDTTDPTRAPLRVVPQDNDPTIGLPGDIRTTSDGDVKACTSATGPVFKTLATEELVTNLQLSNWVEYSGPLTVVSFAFADNGLFILGGLSGQLETSPDGVNWTTRTSQFGTDLVAGAIYAEGLFVIFGANGKLSTSPDGATWTSRAPQFGTSAISAIAYDGSQFAIAGLSGKVSTSPDGINWTSRTPPSSWTTTNALIWGDIHFVMVGGTALNPHLATSSDGITWTDRAHQFGTNAINDVAYANGIYVIVGDAGKISTSTDATTWTARTSGIGTNLKDVVYGNGIFVASGSSGVITSPDGINWTTQTSIINVPSNALIFGDRSFMLRGGATSAWPVQTSEDGVTWTNRPTGMTVGSNTNALVYGLGIYLIYGAVSSEYAISLRLQL